MIKEEETRVTLQEHDDDDRVLTKIFKPKREEKGT